MENGVLFGVIAALIALMLFRMKWKSVSPAGKASVELKQLCEAYRAGSDSLADLQRWEVALSVLERQPSEYNKLDGDIRFVKTFAGYLEKHYPEDPRLEALRKYAGYRKDSIWGIPVKRD